MLAETLRNHSTGYLSMILQALKKSKGRRILWLKANDGIAVLGRKQELHRFLFLLGTSVESSSKAVKSAPQGLQPRKITHVRVWQIV